MQREISVTFPVGTVDDDDEAAAATLQATAPSMPAVAVARDEDIGTGFDAVVTGAVTLTGVT